MGEGALQKVPGLWNEGQGSRDTLHGCCPPATPGHHVPRAMQEVGHNAGTHRLIRGDSERLGGVLVPLPPPALLW